MIVISKGWAVQPQLAIPFPSNLASGTKSATYLRFFILVYQKNVNQPLVGHTNVSGSRQRISVLATASNSNTLPCCGISK